MTVLLTPHAAGLSGCLFTAARLGQWSHPAPYGCGTRRKALA
jgi:hypothetical protein